MPGCEVTCSRSCCDHKAAAAAAKSLQSCPTLCDPIDGSPPGSRSLGFSRQEWWSGVPLPSRITRQSQAKNPPHKSFPTFLRFCPHLPEAQQGTNRKKPPCRTPGVFDNYCYFSAAYSSFLETFLLWGTVTFHLSLLLWKQSCFFSATLTTGDWSSKGHLTRTKPVRILPRKSGSEKWNSVSPGSQD